MFFFLLFSSYSLTQSDLAPPYKQDGDGKINHWELGGGALIEDSSIMLSPPIQYTRGSAWTIVQIPESDWSIQYEFKISEGTQGGGIGLWFISEYAASGELFGGPVTFNGITFLLHVQHAGELLFLNIYHLQNDGTKQYHMFDLVQYDYQLAIDNKNHIIIKLQFSGENIIVSGTGDGNADHIKEFFRVTNHIDIKENYIGITAQSDTFTSRFDLYSANFELYEKEGNTKRKAKPIGKQPSHYQPNDQGRYRSPIFKITNEEAAKKENGVKTNGTSNVIFDMIEELNAASGAVASFKDVNYILRTRIAVYAQKWQKRTVNLLERVKRSRDVTGAALNYTNELLTSFNATLHESTIKTMNKIVDLEQEIADEAEGGVDRYGELDAIKEAATTSMTKTLTYFSIIEIVIVVIAFLLLQLPPIRKRVAY